MLIWGNGELAKIGLEYIWNEENRWEITTWDALRFSNAKEEIKFVVDKEFLTDKYFLHHDLITPEEVNWDKEEYVFLPISYQKCNKLRQEKFEFITNINKIPVSHWNRLAKISTNSKLGRGNWIQEFTNIQPYVEIGDNNVFWGGGVHIGHSSIIGSHNFISTGAVVSGNCKIGNNCFLGVQSSIKDNVEIPDGTVLGQGAIITKSPAKPYQVFLAGVNNLYHKSALEV